MKQNIKENLECVREKIRDAEKKSGRKEGSVTLCAVSKFHPVESILEALNEGQTLFGENRVQEAFQKFSSLKSFSKTHPVLHIIGSLQLNKVKKACEISSCIQSVDRDELLLEIEKQAAKLEKTIDVFFEVKTGEETKSGYISDAPLFSSLEGLAKGSYPHIKAKGLMTMAPFTENEALIHSSFSRLRLLKEKINKEFPSLGITELSMGMSGDYLIAIEEGSTLVRVGTAIFGERSTS